jgi:aryl-alcohol dehydrogenase-like predicted oxidoreductase
LLTGAMTRERIAALPDDDWRKTRSPDFQEPRLARNLALVEAFRDIGQRHGLTAAAVAIAWVLPLPAPSSGRGDPRRSTA